MKTVEEIKAAIATADESDATYTDNSTSADLKASQSVQPEPVKTEAKPA